MTTTETREITNSDDVIDVRDVIARVEKLECVESENGEHLWDTTAGQCVSCGVEDADRDELITLITLLGEIKGNGGDENWRGDWYPLTLVRDSYFEDFARQEAEDLDLIKSDAQWPYTCIDWEKAAEALQMDYTSVSFDGIDYWYR